MTGVARPEDGARKRQLAQSVVSMLETDFAGQVLPFDLTAASLYAELVAQRERAGHSVPMAHAQIAAICLAHGAKLATRNTRHFGGLGLARVDPWREDHLSAR